MADRNFEPDENDVDMNLNDENEDVDNAALGSDDDAAEPAVDLGIIQDEEDDLNIADRIPVKSSIINTSHPDELTEEEDLEDIDLDKYDEDIDLWGDDDGASKSKKSEKKEWDFMKIEEIPDEAIWDEEQRSLFDDEE